jgi:hypothetical protein
VQPREPTPTDGYRLIGRYPDGSSVWQVVAPAAPGFVTLPAGFGAPRRAAGNVIGYPLVSTGVLELRTKQPGVIRLVFDAIPPDGSPRQLVFTDATGDHPLTVRGPTHFALDVELLRGVSDVQVRSEPAATSETDAILVTQPRTERTSGKPVLQLGPSSADPGF